MVNSQEGGQPASITSRSLARSLTGLHVLTGAWLARVVCGGCRCWQAYELSENIADFFLAFDADGDGEVTKDEFLAGARKRPDLVALLVGGKQAAQKEVMRQQSSRRQGQAANLRPAR